MTDFIIKKPSYDINSNTGLALAGQYTKRLGISALVDCKFSVAVGGIPNSSILKSYLNLLVQGKNTFDAIEEANSIARIQPHGASVAPVWGHQTPLICLVCALIADQRQEACRVRRTFCLLRPTSAKVSTNASATSSEGRPRYIKC